MERPSILSARVDAVCGVLAQPDVCGPSARRADPKRAPAPTHDDVVTQDPAATPARIDAPVTPVPAATRARRWGEVPRDEQRELRVRFGQALWLQRVTAGLTQAGLAHRAGLSERTIRALEAGTQRPSDTTTAKLAAALCPHSDAVTVAKMDLQLQADAGRSLRPRNRRKPPRVSRQRIYEEARHQLAAVPATGKPDPVTAYTLAAIEPLPADPWEGARRPAVRP